MKKKVGLVLSGGGAYGYAHLGVMQVLEENNIPIEVVTGTSMGALIGGVYVAGVSTPKMIDISTKFRKSNFLDINPFMISNPGLILGNKVSKLLKNIVGNVNIEDCEKKFAAISCDIKTGNKVSIREGDIVDAIRASISVPGIFAPVKKGDTLLIDGGAVDNMPVEDARELGADFVIAVDVCTYYEPHKSLKTLFDILISSSNIMVANLVDKKKDKGDVYIQINQPGVTQDNFTQVEIKRSIEYGRKIAEEMLPNIKQKLKIK